MRALSIRKNIPNPTPVGGGRSQSSSDSTTAATTSRRTTANSSTSAASSSSSLLNAPNNSEYTPENEVKYKLHTCLAKQTKLKEAVGVLESIPAKHRAPKVNAALGVLYKRLNLTQPATVAFKELLGG